MKFRTEIIISPSVKNITYKDQVMLIGSCFTDNIGKKLESLRFQTNINPFGVVYNPISVKRSLEMLLAGKEYSLDDLERYNDLWYSWDHHSSFSGEDRDQVLERINRKIKKSSLFLRNSRFLFISFGTARIYRLVKNGRIVCNCHKVPAKEFTRELLKVEDIVHEYKKLISDLKNFNPELYLIFTVSPVRHWKDGAHGNQLSKSVLHLAIQRLMEEFEGDTDYFPSYEILLDDLRDYRFYTDDLLHPNEQGIQYIWEKFAKQYFNAKTLGQISAVEDILKAAGHRLINRTSKSSLDFLQKQNEKLSMLKEEMPFLDWRDLEDAFGSRGG